MSAYWRLSASRAAALSGLLAAAAACSGSLPRLPGRTLYVRKCSACHTLHLPAAYPAERWPAIMEAMKGEAKLTEEEARDIERYVLTAAAQ